MQLLLQVLEPAHHPVLVTVEHDAAAQALCAHTGAVSAVNARGARPRKVDHSITSEAFGRVAITPT
jgi:hypothetical protein